MLGKTEFSINCAKNYDETKSHAICDFGTNSITFLSCRLAYEESEFLNLFFLHAKRSW